MPPHATGKSNHSSPSTNPSSPQNASVFPPIAPGLPRSPDAGGLTSQQSQILASHLQNALAPHTPVPNSRESPDRRPARHTPHRDARQVPGETHRPQQNHPANSQYPSVRTALAPAQYAPNRTTHPKARADRAHRPNAPAKSPLSSAPSHAYHPSPQRVPVPHAHPPHCPTKTQPSHAKPHSHSRRLPTASTVLHHCPFAHRQSPLYAPQFHPDNRHTTALPTKKPIARTYRCDTDCTHWARH